MATQTAIAERTFTRAESFIHQSQAELATVARCQAVTRRSLAGSPDAGCQGPLRKHYMRQADGDANKMRTVCAGHCASLKGPTTALAELRLASRHIFNSTPPRGRNCQRCSCPRS